MPELIHYSYMLRLWRERSAAPWRVTLIAVAQPGEHQHFATLGALFAFLITQTGPAPPAHEQVRAPIEREYSQYTPDGVSTEEPLE